MTVKRKKRKVTNVRGPALLVWGVPDQLRFAFRAHCARKNVTMRNEIIRMLEKAVTHDAP